VARTIRPGNLTPGDHILEAYNKDEKLLIRDFWVENEDDILRIEELGVHRITIEEDPPKRRKPPTRQKAPSPGELEQELEQAPSLMMETRTLYRHTVTKIKDIFFSADRVEDIDPNELEPYIEKVLNYAQESPGSIAVLTQIENFDYDTFRHSVNLGILSILYAWHRDYDEEDLVSLALASMLHDIGKIRIPEEIILKEDKLSDQEFEVVKTHSRKGYEMLRDLGIEETLARVALEHHERPDQSGYPDGTDQIHPYSRIVSVFDVYDAMTSRRVYSKEVKPNRAFSVLRSEFGEYTETRSILYDLLRCLGLYPVGCLVRLSSGEVGVIQRNHPDDLKQPVVCVITDEHGDRIASPFLLDLQRIQHHKTMKNGKFYDHGTEIEEVLSLDEIPLLDDEEMVRIFDRIGF